MIRTADSARLAVGTLTILRVRPPERIDRGVARGAMIAAPAVGVGLGLCAAAILWLGERTIHPLPAAVLAVGALAWLTRGLHLDGLADTADALGSGRHGPEAVAVARRPDIGPFGVVAVAVALLIDTSSIASTGLGPLAIVIAAVTGRVAISVACARGIPAATREGLGAAVAESVPRAAAAAVASVAIAGAAAAGWWARDARAGAIAAASVVAGLGIALALVRRCVRRMGGITGDVLGAACESSTAACLVVLAAC